MPGTNTQQGERTDTNNQGNFGTEEPKTARDKGREPNLEPNKKRDNLGTPEQQSDNPNR
jgi:hypothetical protein